MKKKYISPETLVVDICFNHALLAGSPQPTDQNADSDESGNYTNPLSRGFNFDDEEDEY